MTQARSGPTDLKLAENNGKDLGDDAPNDGPSVTPKKRRHLINVDIFNPLGNFRGAKKDTKNNVSAVNSNNDTPVSTGSARQSAI